MPNSEIRSLRLEAGLTQKKAAEKLGLKLNTYGSYERGERTPDYKTMDHIRETLGELAGTPRNIAGREEVDVVTVTPVSAGLGKDVPMGDEEFVLDRRFLAGLDIDMNRSYFVRVLGSGVEPILSHRQIVLVEETDRIAGDDIYVYSCSLEEAHSIAILSNHSGAIEIETRGVRPSVERWERVEGDHYENGQGRTCKLKILGRVVAALGRPSREVARTNEAARIARVGS